MMSNNYCYLGNNSGTSNHDKCLQHSYPYPQNKIYDLSVTNDYACRRNQQAGKRWRDGMHGKSDAKAALAPPTPCVDHPRLQAIIVAAAAVAPLKPPCIHPKWTPPAAYECILSPPTVLHTLSIPTESFLAAILYMAPP